MTGFSFVRHFHRSPRTGLGIFQFPLMGSSNSLLSQLPSDFPTNENFIGLENVRIHLIIRCIF
jgi:hypothetical protein